MATMSVSIRLFTRVDDSKDHVLPDGPATRGAATSWRVYLFLQLLCAWGLPLVGTIYLSTNRLLLRLRSTQSMQVRQTGHR
jgi:hypothetical protein